MVAPHPKAATSRCHRSLNDAGVSRNGRTPPRRGRRGDRQSESVRRAHGIGRDALTIRIPTIAILVELWPLQRFSSSTMNS